LECDATGKDRYQSICDVINELPSFYVNFMHYFQIFYCVNLFFLNYKICANHHQLYLICVLILFTCFTWYKLETIFLCSFCRRKEIVELISLNRKDYFSLELQTIRHFFFASEAFCDVIVLFELKRARNLDNEMRNFEMKQKKVQKNKVLKSSGVNFINILLAAFTCADPKSAI